MKKWLVLGVVLAGLAVYAFWPSGWRAQGARDAEVMRGLADQRAGERAALGRITGDAARVAPQIDAQRREIAALRARLNAVEADRAKRASEGAALVKRSQEPGGAEAVAQAYRDAGYQAVVVRVKVQAVQR